MAGRRLSRYVMDRAIARPATSGDRSATFGVRHARCVPDPVRCACGISAARLAGGHQLPLAPRMHGSYKTEAVVLRSMRLGEADRVLHLYTLDRGRVGAVAKGVRKTKSRFGGRLEPLSHVELQLHQGNSDLQTVTGVSLLRSHHHAR